MYAPMHSAARLIGIAALAAAVFTGAAAVGVEAASPVSMERRAELRHLLIQDCGSCHGLSLGGGLGPPLRAGAIANLPAEYLAATIYYGRPGTAMPPWQPFLTEAESLWLANELKGLNP